MRNPPALVLTHHFPCPACHQTVHAPSRLNPTLKQACLCSSCRTWIVHTLARGVVAYRLPDVWDSTPKHPSLPDPLPGGADR